MYALIRPLVFFLSHSAPFVGCWMPCLGLCWTFCAGNSVPWSKSRLFAFPGRRDVRRRPIRAHISPPFPVFEPSPATPT
ncbi:hypothetical protein C8R43DRAFT_1005585 [Mycena crocata]|nr:hypothetical protein C8R43DRAFT_1005585 [Mycena crocata]